MGKEQTSPAERSTRYGNCNDKPCPDALHNAQLNKLNKGDK